MEIKDGARYFVKGNGERTEEYKEFLHKKQIKQLKKGQKEEWSRINIVIEDTVKQGILKILHKWGKEIDE